MLKSHSEPFSLHLNRRPLCRLSGRKVRTTQSTAPPNWWSSFRFIGKGIESVAENNFPLLRMLEWGKPAFAEATAGKGENVR